MSKALANQKGLEGGEAIPPIAKAQGVLCMR